MASLACGLREEGEVIIEERQGIRKVTRNEGLRTVLRSRHFFGRLWLLMDKVPEPTPAPTYLGRLRLLLQAKRGGSGSIH